MDNFSLHNEHLAEDILNEYLDGYLTPEGIAAVDKHLSACPACAERFHQLQAIFADLEDLPDIPVERDFSRQVLKVIQSKPRIPAFVKWSMLPQLAIALLILLTLLPKYLKGWLALLPKAVNLSIDLDMFNWIAQCKAWCASIQFSLPAWQNISLDIDFRFPALNHINWLLFAVVFALLLIANGYLLRQVVRNGSQ